MKITLAHVDETVYHDAFGERDRLPIYELGTHAPRAFLDGGGKMDPEGPHPKIMFAEVPIMVHLTNGYSIGPISADPLGATEDGHLTGPRESCPRCNS